MLKSFIIAFSTYSKIPMPRVEWDDKSMRYSMCFFPLIGAVISAMNIAALYLLMELGYGSCCIAAVLTVLPILVTGGIHMDGFMDTVDAKSSYRDKEEKLKILKDPHTGAFAIIYGIVYCLLYFGLMAELVRRTILFDDAWYDNTALLLLAGGYIYSRSLSGFSVVTLKKAKQEGMLAATAKASDKAVKGIMVCWIIALIIAFAIIDLPGGLVVSATGIITFFYYRRMAYKTFGGITGDLAGYFLQVCELMILVVCVML